MLQNSSAAISENKTASVDVGVHYDGEEAAGIARQKWSLVTEKAEQGG